MIKYIIRRPKSRENSNKQATNSNNSCYSQSRTSLSYLELRAKRLLAGMSLKNRTRSYYQLYRDKQYNARFEKNDPQKLRKRYELRLWNFRRLK